MTTITEIRDHLVPLIKAHGTPGLPLGMPSHYSAAWEWHPPGLHFVLLEDAGDGVDDVVIMQLIVHLFDERTRTFACVLSALWRRADTPTVVLFFESNEVAPEPPAEFTADWIAAVMALQ